MTWQLVVAQLLKLRITDYQRLALHSPVRRQLAVLPVLCQCCSIATKERAAARMITQQTEQQPVSYIQ